MNTVSLDVHSQASQLHAVTEQGELLLQTKVPTDMALLRSIVGGLPGPKRVVFEEGPLSAALHDALADVADEVISCDPTRNASIARDENVNDESAAQWLGRLARTGSIRAVLTAPEPYRTLRSLLAYDHGLSRIVTSVKNRIKALCRRQRVSVGGSSAYAAAHRARLLQGMSTAGLRAQMKSLFRLLDSLRRERVTVQREKRAVSRQLPIVERLETIPGVGPIVAQTVAAWVVDPCRFARRSQLNAYVGLGLGQGFTSWKPIGKAKASRRGQREVKRVLLLGAMAAISGDNALSRRYGARRQAGWEHAKAIRDVARQMLWIMCAMWRTGKDYDESLMAKEDTKKR